MDLCSCLLTLPPPLQEPGEVPSQPVWLLQHRIMHCLLLFNYCSTGVNLNSPVRHSLEGAPTARDSSAQAGLTLGSGRGLRVSLGRRASPHPAAEPRSPSWGHPLYRLFSLSAVGGECMRVPLLVPNSPSSPCTQLCPPPSCPLPPKATRRPVLVTVWTGGSLSSLGVGQGATPEPLRTSRTSRSRPMGRRRCS